MSDQFDAARQHFQKGHIDEALEAYDALAKANADPVRVALGKSFCYESRGDWKDATEAVATALKTAGKNAALHARLAELQFARGQFDETLKSVEKALQLDANLPLGRLVQADLFTATGKLKEADEQYRWFVRFYNQSQPEDAETLLLVARGASQYARWHSVPKIFDFVINTLCPDALAKDKESWQTDHLSGSLLLEKYNRTQALPEFRQALAINPRAAEVHAALANASLQERDLAEAEQFANRALEINPRLIAALHVKADLKLEENDTAAALKILETATAVNPHDERTLARIATCYLLEDGPPSTVELNELLSNLDTIGEAKIDKSGRFSRLVIELAKRNPHPGVFLGLIGKALEARLKFDLAERFYKQAVASMPQLSEPQTALGMLYMRTGKNDDARRILDRAFDADPYHVRVSNMRKVLKLLDGYETINTEHFVIRIDSQADRILGKYMAEFLEEEYAGLVKQFGFEPPTRTQFEIFNKAKGLSAHEWFSARMVGLPWIQTIGASTGMVVALASPTAAEKPFNWARVLKHEFVHILTLQKTDFNIPHWYTEALAVMNEGYPRPEIWNQLLVERVPKGELMNLDTINNGFTRPKSALDWQMAYCQSRLYAEYLLEKFGPDATSRLLEAYRNRQTTEQALVKLFGVTKADFEKGYRKHLNQVVTQLRSSQPDEPRKLADVEKAHLADPDDAPAAARYAYELLKAGKRKEARQLALKALIKEKREPLAAVVMAQLELRAEDIDAAVTYLETALDRESPHPKVLELLAQLKLKQESYADAAALYELGHERDPLHIAWLKGLAAAYLKNQEPAKLKVVLQKLVALDADDPVTRKKLARMELDEKSYADTIRYGRLALQIDVLDVETHEMLAEAYSGLNQPAKAADEQAVIRQLKTGREKERGRR